MIEKTMTAIVKSAKNAMYFCLGILVILTNIIEFILPVLIVALVIKLLFFM